MSSRRYDTYDSTPKDTHNHERWIPPAGPPEQSRRRPSSTQQHSYDNIGSMAESSRRPHLSSRVYSSNGHISSSLHRTSASHPISGVSASKATSSRTQSQYATHPQKHTTSTARPQAPIYQPSYPRADDENRRKEKVETSVPYPHYRRNGLERPSASADRVPTTEDVRRAHYARQEHATSSAPRTAPAATPSATAVSQAWPYDGSSEKVRTKSTGRGSKEEYDRRDEEDRVRRRRQREEEKQRARQLAERTYAEERYRVAKEDRRADDARKAESRKLSRSTQPTRQYPEDRHKDSDESDASRRRLAGAHGSRYQAEFVTGSSAAQDYAYRQPMVYQQKAQPPAAYTAGPDDATTRASFTANGPTSSSASLYRSRHGGTVMQVQPQHQVVDQERYHQSYRGKDLARNRDREAALAGSETEREYNRTQTSSAKPVDMVVGGQGQHHSGVLPVLDPAKQPEPKSNEEHVAGNIAAQETSGGHQKKGSLNWLFRRESTKAKSKNDRSKGPNAPEVSRHSHPTPGPQVASAAAGTSAPTNVSTTAARTEGEPIAIDSRERERERERVHATPRPSAAPVVPPGLPVDHVSRGATGVTSNASTSVADGTSNAPLQANVPLTDASNQRPVAMSFPAPATLDAMDEAWKKSSPAAPPVSSREQSRHGDRLVPEARGNTTVAFPSYQVAPSSNAAYSSATPLVYSSPVPDGRSSARVQPTPILPQYDIPPVPHSVNRKPSFRRDVKVGTPPHQTPIVGGSSSAQTERTPRRGTGSLDADDGRRLVPSSVPQGRPLPASEGHVHGQLPVSQSASYDHRPNLNDHTQLQPVDSQRTTERVDRGHGHDPDLATVGVNRDSPHMQRSLSGQADQQKPQSQTVPSITRSYDPQHPNGFSHHSQSQQIPLSYSVLPEYKPILHVPSGTSSQRPSAAVAMTPSSSFNQPPGPAQGEQTGGHQERKLVPKNLVASLSEILSDPFRPSASPGNGHTESRNAAQTNTLSPEMIQVNQRVSGIPGSQREPPVRSKNSAEHLYRSARGDPPRAQSATALANDTEGETAGQQIARSYQIAPPSKEPPPAAASFAPRTTHTVDQPLGPPVALAASNSIPLQELDHSPRFRVAEKSNHGMDELTSLVPRVGDPAAGTSETPILSSSARLRSGKLRSSPTRPPHTAQDLTPPTRHEEVLADEWNVHLSVPQPSVDHGPSHRAQPSSSASIRHSPPRQPRVTDGAVHPIAPTQELPGQLFSTPSSAKVATARMIFTNSGSPNRPPTQVPQGTPSRPLREVPDQHPAPQRDVGANPRPSESVSRIVYSHNVPQSTTGAPAPQEPRRLAVPPYSRSNSNNDIPDNDVTPRPVLMRPLPMRDSPAYLPPERFQDITHLAAAANATDNIHSSNIPARSASRAQNHPAPQESSGYPASSVYPGQTRSTYPQPPAMQDVAQSIPPASVKPNKPPDHAARGYSSELPHTGASIPPTSTDRKASVEAAQSSQAPISLPPSIPPAALPAGYGPPRAEPRSTASAQRVGPGAHSQRTQERPQDTRNREASSLHPTADIVAPSPLSHAKSPDPSRPSKPTAHPERTTEHHKSTVSLSMSAVPTTSNPALTPTPVRSNTDTVLLSQSAHAQTSSVPAELQPKRPVASPLASKPTPALIVPPPVNTSRSRESDGLKTPSSLVTPSVTPVPPPLSATPSQDSAKKKGGFFNTLFRTKSSGPAKPTDSFVSSHEIWDAPPQSKSKTSQMVYSRLDSGTKEEVLEHPTSSRVAKPSRDGKKAAPSSSSRIEGARPVALQIPVQPSGRKSPAAKQGLFAKILTPKRHRTMSSASVEALDGTATTVLNSPTASTLSTSPPPIPYRDPWAATQEWRNQAEAEQVQRGKDRRYRPGVTFELHEDPPERAVSRPPPTPRSRRRS